MLPITSQSLEVFAKAMWLVEGRGIIGNLRDRMPWCASVSPCSDGHAKSPASESYWTRDLCAGMVESRQKSSNASGEAGSQQGCPNQGTLGKDMWVRSSTEGNVLQRKMQGNWSTSPSPLIEQHGWQKCRVPMVWTTRTSYPLVRNDWRPGRTFVKSSSQCLALSKAK